MSAFLNLLLIKYAKHTSMQYSRNKKMITIRMQLRTDICSAKTDFTSTLHVYLSSHWQSRSVRWPRHSWVGVPSPVRLCGWHKPSAPALVSSGFGRNVWLGERGSWCHRCHAPSTGQGSGPIGTAWHVPWTGFPHPPPRTLSPPEGLTITQGWGVVLYPQSPNFT